jgi:hypothetical protein
VKRGGPLKRKTRLRAKTPLRRKTPLRNRHQGPKQYTKVRGWVRDRAGGMCEARIDGVCIDRGEHAHHLLRRSQGGPDDMGNLIWVCAPCHGHIHANPAWAVENGLLRKRGAA